MSNKEQKPTLSGGRKTPVSEQKVYEQAQKINENGKEHATVQDGKLEVDKVLRG